jgi:hypothetical protein
MPAARAGQRWASKAPSMNVAPVTGPTADRDARGAG